MMYVGYRSNKSLNEYLKEISRENLLTADEEVELTKIMKTKGVKAQKAKEKMIKSNLRFVVSVAKQYKNQGLSFNDLINEGNLGLIKAASRFDETKGYKFISYAVWWIRQSILQALAEQSRVVRLPSNKISVLNKIHKTRSALQNKFEREPTMEEIAGIMDTTEDEIYNTLKISGQHLSIDSPIKDGEDNRLIDVLKSDQSPQPDSEITDFSLSVEIERALATLSKREKEVITMYFGIDRYEPLTLEEIGQELSLTRERIRQIKEKALQRLRHKSRSKTLKMYLDR
ncbi:MAG: RNA polymerase sigma factor RpoD/SigA [Candidatus Delongbacteria bacterium]|jgi:RNA polymerase primary sigma factor|nr:RNA polymerase sigma factor RpoD/SigA [Candidatus Delongbacteria bacterium]MDY0018229.1 RNA polymerase sigma factor RpoD/SigA [Candidatus Delongbacteria bacterium]